MVARVLPAVVSITTRQIERDQLIGFFGRDYRNVVEINVNRRAAAFLRALVAGVIEQDSPHDARRKREKMRSVLPRDVVLFD